MYTSIADEAAAGHGGSVKRSVIARAAVIGGVGLVLLACVATSGWEPARYGTSMVESTNFVGLGTSRLGAMGNPTLASLPGPPALKELAIAGIEASNACQRDVSAQALADARLLNAYKKLDSKSRAFVGRVAAEITKNTPISKEEDKAFFDAVAKTVGGGGGGEDKALSMDFSSSSKTFSPAKPKDLPGIIAPLGFFDPAGFSTDIDQGKLLFYREAEIKHGRLCMLASLGVLVSEKYHPMYGGFNFPAFNLGAVTIQNLDTPFNVGKLPTFWLGLIAVAAVPELVSMLNDYNKPGEGSDTWTMKETAKPGDYGFDPLGLLPTKAEDILTMKNKELSNGRLAMFAWAGIIAQELVTGKQLFG